MGKEQEDALREYIEKPQIAAGLGQREKLGSAGEYYPIDARQDDIPFAEIIDREAIRKVLDLDRTEEIVEEGFRKLRQSAILGDYMEFYKIFGELRQNPRVLNLLIENLKKKVVTFPAFSGESFSSWEMIDFRDCFKPNINEPQIVISDKRFIMVVPLMEAMANIVE